MIDTFTESVVEQAALDWLKGLGYLILSGPDIAPGQPQAERRDYAQVVLEDRLRRALRRLNPKLPADALDEAFRKLTRPDSPSLVGSNHVFHKFLVDGVPVEYQRKDGSIGGDSVRVLDFDDPTNNEFLAVNQFTVVENQQERRPDIVLFINGLPIVVIVRDMWLTGFDAPCLHTMYVDKPMRGHGLMQAIARVNRVFKDKPGGLVVDYLGLADELRRALANYTESGGQGATAIDQEEAVAFMLSRFEVCVGIFHGFNWSAWKTGGARQRLGSRLEA